MRIDRDNSLSFINVYDFFSRFDYSKTLEKIYRVPFLSLNACFFSGISGVSALNEYVCTSCYVRVSKRTHVSYIQSTVFQFV